METKEYYLMLHSTSLLTSLKNSSRSLLTDYYRSQSENQQKIIVCISGKRIDYNILTDAEAKTDNARLSLQSSSRLSNALALACSCASVAVGMVISFKATSSRLSTDSFF